MLAVISLFGLSLFTLVTAHRNQRSIQPPSKRVQWRLKQLWQEAHRNIKSRQYLRAEKALLTILKFDKKNASAYNRLGILYAKQKEYDDALHCFEVAKSIAPSASNFYNLGLLYFEKQDFEKAIIAFDESIKIDKDNSSRYIALAKAYSKINEYSRAAKALEGAIGVKEAAHTYSLLIEAYTAAGDTDNAVKTRELFKKFQLSH